MKAALLAFALVVTSMSISITALAQASPKVLGTWHLLTQSQGPLNYSLALKVEANQVTALATCTMDGKTTTAQATSAAVVSDTAIQILNAAADEQSNDGLNCSASLQASSMEIELAADAQSFQVKPIGSLPPATRIN